LCWLWKPGDGGNPARSIATEEPSLMRCAALAAAAASTSKFGRALAQTSPAPALNLKDVAEQGFIYGLPIVMNYGVMYEFAVDHSSSQFKAPFNQIANAHDVFTYRDTAVVTPNSDTPYSIVSMDLRAEPLVLSVPPVDPKRYYSVQFCDGNTYNYGYIGSRATGSDAGDYLVVGPTWSGLVPVGIKRYYRSSTQFSFAIYRTQLFNPGDIENVIKVQDGYTVQTLSAYLKKPPPPAAAAVDFPKFDQDLAKTNFFDFLDFALQFAPMWPNEADIRAKLASIGIGPGKTRKFADLSAAEKLEVAAGAKDGEEKIEETIANAGKAINGWRVGGGGGDAQFYDGDWLKRAAIAKAGIYANDAAEATYPFARNDSEGQPLDGSQHAYALTFAADGLPPVNAFWSVTMYDGKTQLLIKNPINRYLINSPMLPDLKKNADGSLTLYIQNRSPGADKDANWLPTPDGPMDLIMRLYWPKKTPPSILPPGEGTWKPPGVVRVS
jgi:hypothetical protein